MRTKVQQVTANCFADSELAEAGEILQRGGLVAFPTETVYGLGGNALSPQAAEKIYAAKGRPSDNPLIVHIADWDSLRGVAAEIPQAAEKLAAAFWPGPMTMIFRKAKNVPATTTGGLDTVAVRMPSHPVAQALIRVSGVYIAAPSANTSGRPSPTCAKHVIEDLYGKVDCIIDSGSSGIGLESTIIDLTGEIPMILRPGYVTRDMLTDVVGTVLVDPSLRAGDMAQAVVAKAPGMKYRHYAPKGKLTIVQGEMLNVVNKINELTDQRQKEGHRTAVIAVEETCERYHADIVHNIGSRKRDGSIAAGLFLSLREMDRLGVEYIYTESFEGDRLGEAIMNRLTKAAGYCIVEV